MKHTSNPSYLITRSKYETWGNIEIGYQERYREGQLREPKHKSCCHGVMMSRVKMKESMASFDEYYSSILVFYFFFLSIFRHLGGLNQF